MATRRVVSTEENEFLTEGVLRFMREPLDLSKLAHADETELNALRERYWQQVRETGVQATGKVFVRQAPAAHVEVAADRAPVSAREDSVRLPRSA